MTAWPTYDGPRSTAPTTGLPLFNNPSLKNFAPRVGFAWDVDGDGKTSLHGGRRNVLRADPRQLLPHLRQPHAAVLQHHNPRNPPFPNPFGAGAPRCRSRLDLLDFDPKNPIACSTT